MTEKEKKLLIEIIANVDDIINELTEEQRRRLKRCHLKIMGNYQNLLDGVPDDTEGRD